MRRTLTMAFLVLACAIRPTSLLADSILSVGSSTLRVGGTTAITLGISGLPHGSALGVYDLSLSFNSNLLSLSGVTFGDPRLGDQLALGGFGSIFSSSLGSNSVEVFELSLAPASVLNASQASTFVLLTLDFKGLKPGSTPLTLIINSLGDANGNFITAQIQNGKVTVQNIATVPEPTTLSLFVLGLSPILLRRLRRD